MGTNLSSDDDNEQVKIDTVINSLKAADHLDKQQLHEAFLSAGLEEVNDTVRKTIIRLVFINLIVSANRSDICSAR